MTVPPKSGTLKKKNHTELLWGHVLHGNTWLKMFMLQFSMVPPKCLLWGAPPHGGHLRAPKPPQVKDRELIWQALEPGDASSSSSPTLILSWRNWGVEGMCLTKISQLSKDTVRTSLFLQDSATFLDLLSHYRGMSHSKVDNHHITFVWFKKYTMKTKVHKVNTYHPFTFLLMFYLAGLEITWIFMSTSHIC